MCWGRGAVRADSHLNCVELWWDVNIYIYIVYCWMGAKEVVGLKYKYDILPLFDICGDNIYIYIEC